MNQKLINKLIDSKLDIEYAQTIICMILLIKTYTLRHIL